jgi:hypothetical protein
MCLSHAHKVFKKTTFHSTLCLKSNEFPISPCMSALRLVRLPAAAAAKQTMRARRSGAWRGRGRPLWHRRLRKAVKGRERPPPSLRPIVSSPPILLEHRPHNESVYRSIESSARAIEKALSNF